MKITDKILIQENAETGLPGISFKGAFVIEDTIQRLKEKASKMKVTNDDEYAIAKAERTAVRKIIAELENERKDLEKAVIGDFKKTSMDFEKKLKKIDEGIKSLIIDYEVSKTVEPEDEEKPEGKKAKGEPNGVIAYGDNKDGSFVTIQSQDKGIIESIVRYAQMLGCVLS